MIIHLPKDEQKKKEFLLAVEERFGNHEGLPPPDPTAFYHEELKLYFKYEPTKDFNGYPPVWNASSNRWKVFVRPRTTIRCPENNLFARMQQTEEGRTLWKLWTDKRFIKGQTAGRPKGAYDGYTRIERNKHKAKAKAESKEIVRLMEKKGFEVPKAEFARESIETAVEIMRMHEISPKDKLAAARTVLEWTMAKPVAQSEVSIKKAEDFLDLVSLEEKKAIDSVGG